MRGQERLRLQFGRTPDSVFCSDPLHPRAARVLLLLLFTVEEHGEKERERERGAREHERDEDSGHFCLGLQRACDVRHALSLSVAASVYMSLSLSVARAQLEHNVPSQWPVNRDRSSTVSLSFDRSSQRRTRDHPLPFSSHVNHFLLPLPSPIHSPRHFRASRWKFPLDLACDHASFLTPRISDANLRHDHRLDSWTIGVFEKKKKRKKKEEVVVVVVTVVVVDDRRLNRKMSTINLELDYW